MLESQRLVLGGDPCISNEHHHPSVGVSQKARDLWEQMNSCSCLTLIVACIIYWQAKDISRVIRPADPERHGIELSLLRRLSPIEWNNIVLYGEYVRNRRLVRRSRSRP